MHRRLITSTCAAALIAFGGCSDDSGGTGGASPSPGPEVPIVVTPFYNAEGPEIAVGEVSERLASDEPARIVELADELMGQRDTLRAEVMYVLAIRLFEVGRKDEAVYWFYSAQYRSRLFVSILDPDREGSIGSEAFELHQAYNAFFQLSGPYINGYAFGDLAKLQTTLSRVVDENGPVPPFDQIYPRVAFIPKEEWSEKNSGVSDGLGELIDSIRTDADLIREQRQARGLPNEPPDGSSR